MKQHGGVTFVEQKTIKTITIVPSSIVRVLALPFDLFLGNTEAFQDFRKSTPSKFSKSGIIRTSMKKPPNLICEIKFGSHLYGTNTKSSDEDYKGIFLPTVEEILLGRIPKTAASTPKDDTRKNNSGELDCEYYSLHHFLRLATQGQTVAIDMLFAPENMVFKNEEYGWIWDEIVANRGLFLSKQMKAFIGYARAQASKYSLKGERLAKLEKVRDILSKYMDDEPFSRASQQLQIGELVQDTKTSPHNVNELQIGGKWYGETTSIGNVRASITNTIDRYGKRARAASDANGLDWKALSHAVRVSKELSELLSFGSITFPLTYSKLLLDIKLGKLSLEEVQNILDRELTFIEVQMQQSSLPEKVNTKHWDDFLAKTISRYLGIC